MKEAFIISVCIAWAALAACTLSGCAALVGIKEWPTEHGPIKFVTGFDLTAGASGVDSLDNRKGINAKELR